MLKYVSVMALQPDFKSFAGLLTGITLTPKYKGSVRAVVWTIGAVAGYIMAFVSYSVNLYNVPTAFGQFVCHKPLQLFPAFRRLLPLLQQFQKFIVRQHINEISQLSGPPEQIRKFQFHGRIQIFISDRKYIISIFILNIWRCMNCCGRRQRMD